MTKEQLNKMTKTANVDDHKVYVVIDGKGRFVNIGEISLPNDKGELTPLKDVLIGLNVKYDTLKKELDTRKSKSKEINKLIVKELKKIKKEVGLE